MKKVKVLLLAGTSEAIGIAEGLACIENVDAAASMAGATRAPRELAVPLRTGGFGGETGFAAFLKERGIDLVVDATHPFAARMTATSSKVCAGSGVPYLRVERPAWIAKVGDSWHAVDTVQQARDLIPSNARIFLGTGRQTLMEFGVFDDCHILCRVIDPPQSRFPFEGGKFVVGRPPFSVQHEVDLFRKERIDWLVVKNSGGWRSKSKLDAARELGLPVVMFNRPARPNAPLVETVEDALIWVEKELSK